MRPLAPLIGLVVLAAVEARAQPDPWVLSPETSVSAASVRVLEAATGTILRQYDAPPGTCLGSGAMTEVRRWYLVATNLGWPWSHEPRPAVDQLTRGVVPVGGAARGVLRTRARPPATPAARARSPTKHSSSRRDRRGAFDRLSAARRLLPGSHHAVTVGAEGAGQLPLSPSDRLEPSLRRHPWRNGRRLMVRLHRPGPGPARIHRPMPTVAQQSSKLNTARPRPAAHPSRFADAGTRAVPTESTSASARRRHASEDGFQSSVRSETTKNTRSGVTCSTRRFDSTMTSQPLVRRPSTKRAAWGRLAVGHRHSHACAAPAAR